MQEPLSSREVQHQLGVPTNATRSVPGGVYVTIEGPSCTGKDTQIALLQQYLAEQGYATLRTRQPGGTPIGVGIREVLLRPDLRPQHTPKSEAMLYWADRVHQHDTVVKPALAKGIIVLGSRDFDSSYVYQCAVHGLDETWMDGFRSFLIGDFAPTRTIVLTIDRHTFRRRSEERKRTSASDRNETRVDEQAVEEFETIREAFLERTRKEPHRFVVIDAERTIAEVQQDIRSVVEMLIRERTK